MNFTNSLPSGSRRLAIGALAAGLAFSGLVAASIAPVAAITNGTPVGAPWSAYINSKASGQCTGTIVAPGTVLTAAHCVVLPNTRTLVPFSSLSVIFNRHEGKTVHSRAANVALDPQWDPSTTVGDLALIQVLKPLPVSAVPVPVAPPNFDPHQAYASEPQGPGINAYGYGWVSAACKVLPILSCVPTHPKADKGLINETLPHSYQLQVTCPQAPHSGDLCFTLVGSSEIMHGDSGGPWLVNDGATAADLGTTTTPLDVATTSSGFTTRNDPGAQIAWPVDLTNAAANAWVTKTAGTVLKPGGQCSYKGLVECVVTAPSGSSWYVHDGFGHPITPNSGVSECLAGKHIPAVTIKTNFEFDEVPLESTPATCSLVYPAGFTVTVSGREAMTGVASYLNGVFGANATLIGAQRPGSCADTASTCTYYIQSVTGTNFGYIDNFPPVVPCTLTQMAPNASSSLVLGNSTGTLLGAMMLDTDYVQRNFTGDNGECNAGVALVTPGVNGFSPDSFPLTQAVDAGAATSTWSFASFRGQAAFPGTVTIAWNG